MTLTIQKLPSEVVNLIAAGEVIDSLGAVVRELVENSLDAGATRITVNINPDLWQVQVTDNGKGMSLEDLSICTSAHSTSKINKISDLDKITSLGFRGEALHSIAQLAQLEILSRLQQEELTGWKIIYQQDKMINKEVKAIAPGTIITVTDLFGKLPLRRKGLPSLKQQLKTIQNWLGDIALCYPNIAWQVHQNNQPWFNISPAKNPEQILAQILKSVKISDLNYLSLEVDKSTTIQLLIGLPDRCHRNRPDWLKIAVNGRMVKLPELEQIIIKGFAKTLPRDRYPVSFLHLKINPEQIDWNRHPAKTQIYLHQLEFWQEQVNLILEKSLGLSNIYLPQNLQNQRVEKLLTAAEKKGEYQINKVTKNPEEINLLELKVVGQIRNTYIVAEHPNGLWLIEQHIAHERILYEQLEDNWQLVALNSPIILNQLNPLQIEQLTRIGLEIEAFGEELWAIRNVPEMLCQRSDCGEALIELSLVSDLPTAQVAIACRSAIRNGQPMIIPEMQNLVNQWQNTRNPRTCPHGRPIYLSLEETALARFFRRHWMIGKSHGI